MNAKELAAKLDGCEWGKGISVVTAELAQIAGLVIVYGASDDLMEFEGAIRDEVSGYDSITAYLDEKGLLVNDCDCDDCPHFKKQIAVARTIKGIYRDGGTWTFETSIPHERFRIIEDDLEHIGIVFAMSDLAGAS